MNHLSVLIVAELRYADSGGLMSAPLRETALDQQGKSLTGRKCDFRFGVGVRGVIKSYLTKQSSAFKLMCLARREDVPRASEKCHSSVTRQCAKSALHFKHYSPPSLGTRVRPPELQQRANCNMDFKECLSPTQRHQLQQFCIPPQSATSSPIFSIPISI